MDEAVLVKAKAEAMAEADARYGADTHGPRDAFETGVDAVLRRLRERQAPLTIQW